MGFQHELWLQRMGLIRVCGGQFWIPFELIIFGGALDHVFDGICPDERRFGRMMDGMTWILQPESVSRSNNPVLTTGAGEGISSGHTFQHCL